MANKINEQGRKRAAKDFAAYWKDKGYEKGESQKFWLDLLEHVYGVENAAHFIEFEDQVHLDHTSFIDGYIPETKVLIEQKSINKSLRAPIKQSDGSLLTPFQQAKRYSAELPYSKRPRWIITCNFAEFLIYDMENPNAEPEQILLKNLPNETYRLNFLTDVKNENIKREMEVSIKAGELVGQIYDALRKQYVDPDSTESLKSLNVLCVRFVFCLYAEDADVFNRNLFHDYLNSFSTKHMRAAIIDLFKVLNTPINERDPYLDEELAAFPYVNGGLFAEEKIEIPQFTDEIRQTLLQNASADFDWSEISPTIFGAVFESTLNPETRRKGGMHYTSIENIHKVIDPLFLNDLRDELEDIKVLKQDKVKIDRLNKFCDKLASLKFLDPACGSGNFLTETYISLRTLENEALKLIYKDQIVLDTGDIIKVKINQFYGIEINDFAVTVAKTALWIAENQMMQKTADIVHMQLDFLPLTTNAYIVEGNALRINWDDVVDKNELNYIMGNPPFVGMRSQTDENKKDMKLVIPIKKYKQLDYVACWYFKSAEYIKGTAIKCAFVSSNSITQGEQALTMWKPLFYDYSIDIIFAHRTFRWDSEAKIIAHVHCVIIGFSYIKTTKKTIFENGKITTCEVINQYLLNAPVMFIDKRGKSLCKAPVMTKGAQLIDGGNFMINGIDEYHKIIEKEPIIKPYIRKYYNAKALLNYKQKDDTNEYALYLENCPPNIIRSSPFIKDRVEKVYKFRAENKSPSTRALKDTPSRYFQPQAPMGKSLVVPVVSSEKRRYVPVRFMDSGIVYTNALFYIDNASIYHFGIISSNVHMAWMRAVCGRLEMRYRYSNTMVYNTFPWCNPTPEQKAKIEQTAQAILDARALYPDSSLADLYDELTMPPELRKAHQNNDRAVMAAYGFSTKMTESECVAELMKMYSELTKTK